MGCKQQDTGNDMETALPGPIPSFPARSQPLCSAGGPLVPSADPLCQASDVWQPARLDHAVILSLEAQHSALANHCNCLQRHVLATDYTDNAAISHRQACLHTVDSAPSALGHLMECM